MRPDTTRPPSHVQLHPRSHAFLWRCADGTLRDATGRASLYRPEDQPDVAYALLDLRALRRAKLHVRPAAPWALHQEGLRRVIREGQGLASGPEEDEAAVIARQVLYYLVHEGLLDEGPAARRRPVLVAALAGGKAEAAPRAREPVLTPTAPLTLTEEALVRVPAGWRVLPPEEDAPGHEYMRGAYAMARQWGADDLEGELRILVGEEAAARFLAEVEDGR